MKCKFCGKDFDLISMRGGHNRIFCYECLPVISDRATRNRARYHLLVQYSNKLKLERGCDRCGYNKCAAALEWHHLNQNKDADPSSLLRNSLDKYLEEIKKCELLCANCHREEHSTL